MYERLLNLIDYEKDLNVKKELEIVKHKIDRGEDVKKTIYETQHTKELHKLTTQYVNAGHQAELLRLIEPHLTENEQDLVRRARNLQVPISRRGIQADYRQATAFEVLVGYLYLNDKNRLEEIYSIEGVL